MEISYGLLQVQVLEKPIPSADFFSPWINLTVLTVS